MSRACRGHESIGDNVFPFSVASIFKAGFQEVEGFFETTDLQSMGFGCGQARGENKAHDCFINVIVRENSVEFLFFHNRRENGNYTVFPRVVKPYPGS